MLELLERHGGVVPPVTIGLLKDRELARRMLAEEGAGKVLPAGFSKAATYRRTCSGARPTAATSRSCGCRCPASIGPAPDDRWYWILLQACGPAIPKASGLVAERCDVTMRHPRFGRDDPA